MSFGDISALITVLGSVQKKMVSALRAVFSDFSALLGLVSVAGAQTSGEIIFLRLE